MYQYQYFLKIVETKNLTKASEQLFITQPSLSKYLKGLETSLHVQLFERTKKSLTLTPAGKIFYDFVMETTRLEEKLFHDLLPMQNLSITQELRIGIGPWRGSYMLPDILSAFAKLCPNVTISVLEGSDFTLLDAIYRQKIDLCIMGAADLPHYTEYEILHNEKILFCGNRNHPALFNILPQTTEQKENIYVLDQLSAFDREAFILTPETTSFTKIIQEYLDRIQFHPPSIMRIRNLSTVVHMIERGSYFTFLPEIVTKNIKPDQAIVFFSLDNLKLLYPVCAVHHKEKPLSEAAMLLIQSIKDYYYNF